MQKYFDYLFSLERTGIKYDLSNITRLMKHLGEPHKHFRTIHIAGTNGKGATASFIASILIESGYKTGLYTSPHIIKFNERISVNNRNISDKYIASFIEENRDIIRKVKPSFFELTTAMAFKYFSDRKIQVAVIETGMGGRLDSTNIVESDIAVVTKIAFDHQKYLGNTLKKIASEKIGIVKKDSLVVVSDNTAELRDFFRKKIPDSRLFMLDEKVKIQSKDGATYLKFPDSNITVRYHKSLPGKFQIINASAAALAYVLYMKKHGIDINIKFIENGIRNIKLNTNYRCRLEIIKQKNRTFILDVSHNPDAVRNTLNELDVKPDVIIFAMMKDKDYKAALKELLKHCSNLILTGIRYPRAVSPYVLCSSLPQTDYNTKNITVAASLEETKSLLNKLNYRNMLFIGSFFLISEVISTFGLNKYLKR